MRYYKNLKTAKTLHKVVQNGMFPLSYAVCKTRNNYYVRVSWYIEYDNSRQQIPYIQHKCFWSIQYGYHQITEQVATKLMRTKRYNDFQTILFKEFLQ